MRARYALVLTVLVMASVASGQDVIKQIPPPGKPIPAEDRRELEAGVAKLGAEITGLRERPKGDAEHLGLLPDVQIYYNAVRYPLTYDEPLDVAAARAALAEGLRRAAALRDGKADWTATSGPRGYVSRIDGSVQPFILIVPDGGAPADGKPRRLDFFCHGRDENLTELKFLSARIPATAGGHFLVNLYGRYCNANKFAGEIDLLEVLDAMKSRYPIDENRVVETGFSMGGAASWQFAVHYTDLFAAASPGAGFSETKHFLHLPNNGADAPWYERKLWHLYDCTDYAVNLFNLPTIAYAGELDGQKQASDEMDAAMRAEGLTLERLIGPGTKHEYHKETKQELDRRLAAYAERGHNPLAPKVRLTTWTLRYNRMHWVTVDGMERHWERGRVDAEITPTGITATTKNVSAVTFNLTAAASVITIDGASLAVPGGARTTHLVNGDAGWIFTTEADSGGELRKRHGLQGPIDDAFLDRFVFVLPTGKPRNEKVGKWVEAESRHAIDHWRKQFRGEARVKHDSEVTDADIADSNLVLWGDPSSNSMIQRVAVKLPFGWGIDQIMLGDALFAAGHHVPVMIYPNPLNPRRYVVLNSGFTFREFDYLNNARQVPKLPDYAVLDIDAPPGPHGPGRVVKAGFFGERWEVLPDDGRGGDRE